jgi:hypothetical protein
MTLSLALATVPGPGVPGPGVEPGRHPPRALNLLNWS